MAIYDGDVMEIEELLEGNYLMRLQNHVSELFVGPVIPKSILSFIIAGKGWSLDDVVIEDGNLKFLGMYG